MWHALFSVCTGFCLWVAWLSVVVDVSPAHRARMVLVPHPHPNRYRGAYESLRRREEVRVWMGWVGVSGVGGSGVGRKVARVMWGVLSRSERSEASIAAFSTVRSDLERPSRCSQPFGALRSVHRGVLSRSEHSGASIAAF